MHWTCDIIACAIPVKFVCVWVCMLAMSSIMYSFLFLLYWTSQYKTFHIKMFAVDLINEVGLFALCFYFPYLFIPFVLQCLTVFHFCLPESRTKRCVFVFWFFFAWRRWSFNFIIILFHVWELCKNHRLLTFSALVVLCEAVSETIANECSAPVEYVSTFGQYLLLLQETFDYMVTYLICVQAWEKAHHIVGAELGFLHDWSENSSPSDFCDMAIICMFVCFVEVKSCYGKGEH